MRTRHGTELPGSLREIFENKEAIYKLYQDYREPDMDNVESLRWFIECLSIHSDNIESDEGTQVVLSHQDFNYKIVIDSTGAGDTHSHLFEASILEEK